MHIYILIDNQSYIIDNSELLSSIPERSDHFYSYSYFAKYVDYVRR